MAFASPLEQDEREIRGLHPTQVVCRYMVCDMDERRVLQLNTYGSPGRQMPDKLSQTLQFSEETARQLHALLDQHFSCRDT